MIDYIKIGGESEESEYWEIEKGERLIIRQRDRIFGEHMLGVMKWMLEKSTKKSLKGRISRHIRLLYGHTYDQCW